MDRDNEKRYNSNREGSANRDGEKRASYPRRDDAKPSFNSGNRPNREGGDRPRTPYNREGGSDNRGARPAFNRDSKPSFGNRSSQGGDKPWRSNSDGGRAPRPAFNRDGNRTGGEKPWQQKEGARSEGGRSERPAFNRDSNSSYAGNRPSQGDKPWRSNSEGGRSERPAFNRDSNSSYAGNRPSQGDKPWRSNSEGGRGSDRPAFNRDSNSSYAGNRPSQGDKPWRSNSEGAERGEGSRSERPAFNRDSNSSYAGNRPSQGDKPWRSNSEGGRGSDRPAFNRDSNSSFGSRPQSSGDKPWERKGEGDRARRPSGNYGGPRIQQEGGAGERSRRPRIASEGQTYARPVRKTDDYDPNAKYSQKKQIEYKQQFHDPNAPVRLNKYLANAGVCSRREADEFITAGVVTVNEQVVTELGTKVLRSDVIKFHGEEVSTEGKVYVLLNKPKDCVTTSDDPQARLTVMDLIKNACKERIYPVGRLDRNTTGVLLLTNDGDLASKLTHPKFVKKKIYHVHLDKNVTKAHLEQIAEGIELEDGEIHADAISYATETDKDQVGIEIHSGRNRIVRRIFETLGYKVMKLDRVYFAGLTKKSLRRGEWRHLTEREVIALRMGSFE